MRATRATVATLALLLGGCALWPFGGTDLGQIVQGEHRTPAFTERDLYRNPVQTLEFFGLRPDMTVVEVWPGAGWYTEILAPYLRDRGRYYAAGFVMSGPKVSDYRRKVSSTFLERLSAHPHLYDRVIVTELGPPRHWQPAPDGSADMVLTFRNVHNWMAGGYEQRMFRAFYRTLKPGGVLGVVEHRAKPGTSRAKMKKSGYVTEEYVIKLAERAGFKLEDRSEINANPVDTKDHPEGVWTLPPTLRLGDKDRHRYQAIGESDRMTLRFVKPLGTKTRKQQPDDPAG